MREVWWRRGRGVKEPAAGAQVALHAGAAEEGGSGGERVPLVPAAEQRLRLHGLQQLSRPVAVHSRRRWVGGRRAGLHRRGDGGVTDDGWPVRNEAHGGGSRGGRRLPQDAGHGGLEAGGVQDALVAALLAARRGAAVFRRLRAVREAVAALAAFPGDGELIRVFAIFPQHLGEEASPGVDEPVAHLGGKTKTERPKPRSEKAVLRFALQSEIIIIKRNLLVDLAPGAVCATLNSTYYMLFLFILLVK